MASNTSLCKVCRKRSISRVATDWCGTCNAAFCKECKQIHDFSPASERHVTISFSESDGTLVPIEGIRCEVHDDTYELFCRSHDQMICLTCLDDHSSCKDVISLAKIVGGVKESELHRDVETELSDSIDNMSTIATVLKDNYSNIDGDKDQSKKEVKKLCDQAVDRIWKAHSRIEAEIDDKSEAEKSTIRKTTVDLEKKKSEFTELLSQLKIIKEYGTDIQMFVVLREILKKLQKNEEQLRVLKESCKTDKVELSFKSNDSVEDILKIDTLGIIETKHAPTVIKLKQSKEKQAQFVQPRIQSRALHDIKLNHTTTISYQCSNLTGLSVLPDGKILICDYDNRWKERNPIVVIDKVGNVLSTIPLSGTSVFDVAVIDKNTVAVTSGVDHTVSIVDIPSSGTKRFRTDNNCFGITYFNHYLYCCVRSEGILKLSINTGETSAFYKTDLSDSSYITYYNNKLYFTDSNNRSVTCCDMKGSQIWKVENPVIWKWPRGIAVDNFSLIYIADYRKNNVVLLSEDGKKGRDILTKGDGLSDPHTVFYDTANYRIIVGNQQGKVWSYNYV